MNVPLRAWVSIICLIDLACVALTGCKTEKKNGELEDYSVRRESMVAAQIRARGITDDKILEVMKKIPRHEFIPEKMRNIHNPYGDHPVPIGEEQTISQPYIVALMTQTIDPNEGDKVLEIGTGSGYQAAILAELGCKVYTIEIIESLANMAKQTFERLGCKNIEIKTGDGYKGWSEHAPYDAIIVTCAPDHIPKPLTEQLKEGGRMVIPVGDRYVQKLYLVVKEKREIKQKAIIPVIFVPMTGEAEKK